MANISLRPLTIEDTSNIVKWRNQEEVRQNLYNQELLTESQHLYYYENNIKTGMVRQYVIVAHGDKEDIDIGTIFLKNIDKKSNKSEIGLFIGEKEFRSGGYGTAALKMAISTAFSDLSLNKIYATIMEDNAPSRKMFSKAGFIESGLLLENYLNTSGYKNVVLVEITKSMWQRISN